MAITTNQTVQFNIDSIVDDQVLVYDANVGAFVNTSIGELTANSQITGMGRNVGSAGVGLYKANDGAYLEFYKINSGANTSITLVDDIITIDAVVGKSSVDLQQANANTIAVYDASGNTITGSDTVIVDENGLTIVGTSNNIVISDGTITANTITADNLQLTSGVSFPSADGSANQVLSTDGNGTLSWVNNTDISTKVDSTVFNAYQATALTTVSNHAPALHNLYSLGNATNKYSQVFSTYFRGTADIAVNSQNLGSHPAANYLLRSDSYDADQIDTLISSISIPNVSDFITGVTVTNGVSSYTSDTIDISSADSNIIVITDPITNSISLQSNIALKTFTRISVNGNASNYLVAEQVNDVLNFNAGEGITLSANPSNDTITISSVGSGGGGDVSSISDLSDVGSINSIQNGQALVWNSSTQQFEGSSIAAVGGANTLAVGTRTSSVNISLVGGSTLTVIGRTTNVAISLS